VAAIAAAAYAIFRYARRDETTYFTARVEKGDIHDVVEVTGTINAVTTVLVGSQVSGTIAKLSADFNSRVHKGEVIAVIEPSLFQGALLQAEADVDSAKANVVAARANLEKAKATLAQAKADFDRATTLVDEGMVSKQALDTAKAAFGTANASVGAAVAGVTQAEAQVSQKAAAVAIAKINLQYTVIRSPIDGTVVARNVDVGQTVAASLQAPTLFTIAQDLKKMQVYAKTDESDVGNIKVGRVATFKVDAFPKQVFKGTVSQVRMNPTTVQNVVTYDAIIAFDNPDLSLFPGMTAYVTVPVADATDVLKVPNGALRWRPAIDGATLRSMYEKRGIVPARPVAWRMHPGDSIEPVQVAPGITDHAFTAITSGALHEGDEVITGAVVAKGSAPGALVPGK
ncbi:MAG TPA: efflux RND transporter periplasmic adaptor subunit, partial [Usitatibacter sp.]